MSKTDRDALKYKTKQTFSTFPTSPKSSRDNINVMSDVSSASSSSLSSSNVNNISNSPSLVSQTTTPPPTSSSTTATAASATKSYIPILCVFFLYSVAFSLVIPAIPSLLLHIFTGRTEVASLYYGIATALKYLLLFFSSQVLGILSESVGRKRILSFSLFIVSLEFFLLARYPSVYTIFLTRIMSGVGDATSAMGYAVVTDIAILNRESVTTKFGLIGASFGFAFIIGPLCGSYLVSKSLSLCFLVAGCTALAAFTLCIFILEESLPFPRIFSFARSNPLSSLRIFFANNDLACLAIPYSLSNLSTGIYFIWVLYMEHRFKASIFDIGLFLSTSGLCTVLVQGGLVQLVIPRIWTDEKACLRFMSLACIQMILYGIAPSLFFFYIAMLALSPASVYGPALKSLLARAAGPDEQGALQGALGSLRTVTAGGGALLFSWIYSFSISRLETTVPGLPFFVAAVFYLIAITGVSRFLTEKSASLSPSASASSAFSFRGAGIYNDLDDDLLTQQLLEEANVIDAMELLPLAGSYRTDIKKTYSGDSRDYL